MSAIEDYLAQLLDRVRGATEEERMRAQGVYALSLAEGEERMVLAVEADDGHILDGDAPADVEVRLTRPDLIDLAAGRLNPMTAFMAGRVELSGDVERALRLWALIR